MPWKESRIVDQRLQFLSSYQKEEMSVSDLCREFGVSRQTGYRWINRYKEVGPEGLLNRSSKPNADTHAKAAAEEVRWFPADVQSRASARRPEQQDAWQYLSAQFHDATARLDKLCLP